MSLLKQKRTQKTECLTCIIAVKDFGVRTHTHTQPGLENLEGAWKERRVEGACAIFAFLSSLRIEANARRICKLTTREDGIGTCCVD